MSELAERRRLTLVLVAMTAANAMILVDQTAVPLALPDIMKSFGVGSQSVQWVLNASLLPLAGLLVFGGRLGDLFGRRRIFQVGAVVFATASAVGGLAPDFGILLVARVAQGIGGALMLPATVAIVSGAFPAEARGRALGTMGGAAAVAAALGPTIGGLLTSAFSWRAVLWINVPLAIAAVLIAARHVRQNEQASPEARHVDTTGTALLTISLVGLVFGLSQSQAWGWGSGGVWLPIVVAVVSFVLFVLRERRATTPLVDFVLLRHRNYLGASISQFLAGMAEIGLGVIFPLLLILNLGMSPALAGLALIPTTLPMIAVAPLAGRWYDRVGGRPPLVTGFVTLALSGVMLAVAADAGAAYLGYLPGLLVYGIGLSLILSVNDPVTLDTIPDADGGQASGVSATAEQFGGAVGIAALYAIFHATYLDTLHEKIDAASVPDLSDAQLAGLRDVIQSAESTGLHFRDVETSLQPYVLIARTAAEQGYTVTFAAVAVIAALGAAVTWRLVRRPEQVAARAAAGPGAAPRSTP